jgi:hypothetical protein
LYLTKDTFDSVAVAVAADLEVVAVLSEDFDEIIGAIDEEHDAVEPVAAVQVGQKPAGRLFRLNGKQPDVEDFVGRWVDGGVHPVVDRDMTP